MKVELKMKVKDLKNILEEYNQEAEISILINNQKQNIRSILFGSSEGVTMETAEDVVIEPDNSNNFHEEENND